MNSETDPVKLLVCFFNEMELLRGKALTARQRLIDQYNYDVNRDYRISVFEQIDRLLIFHDTSVILFLRYIMHPEYVSELFKTSETDSKRIAVDYLQRTRHALIIFIQSVVESFYRSLCHALSIKESFSFAKLFTSIFNHFQLSTDDEWYKANDILSKVRNTLHNNGVHTHPDDKINFHGKDFIFSKNSPHQSGGYETIIWIIGDLIEFISYIGETTSDILLIDNHNLVDDNYN